MCWMDGSFSSVSANIFAKIENEKRADSVYISDLTLEGLIQGYGELVWCLKPYSIIHIYEIMFIFVKTSPIIVTTFPPAPTSTPTHPAFTPSKVDVQAVRNFRSFSFVMDNLKPILTSFDYDQNSHSRIEQCKWLYLSMGAPLLFFHHPLF